MHLLAATVGLPDFDRKGALEGVEGVAEGNWFWDPYRGTAMLPLMTMGGVGGKSGTSNFREKQEFSWVSYTPQSIVEWFERVVFPWMGMKTRVMVLRTEPGASNLEHIDCAPSSFGLLQHKFRVVLQGSTDSLYFITRDGSKKLFNTTSAFIMDGSWPHGMINDSSKRKYTIAVGAPWCGNKYYDNISNQMYIDREMLPKDLNSYFDSKYLVNKK